jgi:hypothetical protein
LLGGAFALYQDGHKWYLDDIALIREAEAQAMDRVEHDVWQSIVETYCDCSLNDSVSIEEILEYAMRKPKEHWTQPDRNRIGRCLRIAGYQRFQSRAHARTYRYSKPDRTLAA